MRFHYITHLFSQLPMLTANTATPQLQLLAQSTYNGEPPIYLLTYCESAERAPSHQAVEDFAASGYWQGFDNQMTQLINQLQGWCYQNMPELNSNDLHQWSRLSQNWLSTGMAGNAATLAYGIGKKSLESIWMYLQAPNTDKQRAKDVLKQALKTGALTVCTEGSVTNVLNMNRDIQQNPHQVFKGFINELIEQRAIEAVNQLRNFMRVGVHYETHVAIIFSNMLGENFGLPCRKDEYTTSWFTDCTLEQRHAITCTKTSVLVAFNRDHTLAKLVVKFVEHTLLPKIRACHSETKREEFKEFLNAMGEDEHTRVLLFDPETGALLDDGNLAIKLAVTVQNRLVQSGMVVGELTKSELKHDIPYAVRELNKETNKFELVKKTRTETTTLFNLLSDPKQLGVILFDKNVMTVSDLLFKQNETQDHETERFLVWQALLGNSTESPEAEFSIDTVLYAAMKGKWELIQAIIDRPGINMSARLVQNLQHALTIAIIAGQEKLAANLVKLDNVADTRDTVATIQTGLMSPSFDAKKYSDSDLQDVLLAATVCKKDEMVERLMEARDASRCDWQENSPIMGALDVATQCEDKDLIKSLLLLGVTENESLEQSQVRLSNLPNENQCRRLFQYDHSFNNAWSKFLLALSPAKQATLRENLNLQLYKSAHRRAGIEHSDINHQLSQHLNNEVHTDRAKGVRILAAIVCNFLAGVACLFFGLGAIAFCNAKKKTGSAGLFFMPSSAAAHFRFQRETSHAQNRLQGNI